MAIRMAGDTTIAAPPRTIVKPKQTEVFVDGYFVGVADDFDGVFQGMKLDPGGHEITLYLDGYRTSKHKVMLQEGKTFKLKHDMVKLGANEPKDARPVPPPTPPGGTARCVLGRLDGAEGRDHRREACQPTTTPM